MSWYFCYRCNHGFSIGPNCPFCGMLCKSKPSRGESKAVFDAFRPDSAPYPEGLTGELFKKKGRKQNGKSDESDT